MLYRLVLVNWSLYASQVKGIEMNRFYYKIFKKAPDCDGFAWHFDAVRVIIIIIIIIS